MFKMRYDSVDWFDSNSPQPAPVVGRSFLLMCETRGSPKPLPVMRWFFNGRELQTHGSRLFYVIVRGNPIKSGFCGWL